MREFESPATFLGAFDAEVAGRFIASVCDVALVLDDAGFIRDLAFGSDDLVGEGYYDWLGKPWLDTVTVESKPKVEALLQEAKAQAPLHWRHINHPSIGGADLPLSYGVLRLPSRKATSGKAASTSGYIAFGRDLRAAAALQQRLVSAQQAMERDYWRLRNMETRYRSLFERTAEAVMIADAASLKLEEANPAAERLFGAQAMRTGSVVAEAFGASGSVAVQALLTKVATTGQANSVVVKRFVLAEAAAGPGQGGKLDLRVSASLFRQDRTSHVLVRVEAMGDVPVKQGLSAQTSLHQLIEAAPDAFVMSDLDGRVLTANTAFLQLAQLSGEAQARGLSLDRWVGRTGVDLSVLITNVRQRGAVRLFSTVLRGESGATAEVEISAVAVLEGEQPCIGLTIRDVSRRLTPEPVQSPGVSRSVGEMTELVGRVPLKDIVRDTTDLIEQLCIEAALQLTNDNRASAAEMLGLSRQSLYVKLRRFNIGDLASMPADDQA